MNIIKLLVVALLVSTTAFAKTSKKNEKPNIILIYADDLGRGMLSTYGQKYITTPNIDRIADFGMRFENAYGCNYCAPARASLLTGMHDARRDLFNISTAGIYMNLDNGMSFQEIKDEIHDVMIPAKPNDVFLAEVAKKAGYATAEFGKIDWGFATTPERIERHGWDYHYGFYDHQRCHGFYPPFLFENGEKVDIPGNTHVDCGLTNMVESPEGYKARWDMTGKAQYSEDLIVDKMMEWMDDHHKNKLEQPFFAYFPTQLPHGPIAVPAVHPEVKNNPDLTEMEKEYASMIKYLDNSVGQIFAKLEEQDILDNTILIFTSDNGHEVYARQPGRTDTKKNMQTGQNYDDVHTRFLSDLSNDVFDGNNGMSGLKRANWEGGTRVPLFWFWQGNIKAGSSSDQRVANYDILNTVAELMGQDQEKGKDSKSYAKTLLGGKSKAHDYIVLSSRTMGPSIVTQDGWKMKYHIKGNSFQLYKLDEDYKELNDLAMKYPEKLETLKTILLKECGGDWQNGYGPLKVKMASQQKSMKKKKKH
ncbi:sulfatase-like hydrolase/transferase [Saccharicrinis aurantiacus]|uniref:sulfatase-like hydrolase/transferase n=1 Tax=Saccharicrinis aurantiacus TaxID=1849719 RepID=UPI00248FE0F2|nr:sulfatase-like hydrolase/transferase [Saccharicrinis aurantiacus]